MKKLTPEERRARALLQLKKREEQRDHWRKIWDNAVRTMPSRVTYINSYNYNPIKGEMNIGLFAALHAKGNIRMRTEGDPAIRRTILVSRITYSQHALFFLLMGVTRSREISNMARAMLNGCKPKNPATQRRLINLSKNGNKIAWKFLRLVGRDHLYLDEDPAWVDLYHELNPGKCSKYKRPKEHPWNTPHS